MLDEAFGEAAQALYFAWYYMPVALVADLFVFHVLVRLRAP